MSNSPLAPRLHSQAALQPEDEDTEMLDIDQSEDGEEEEDPQESDSFSRTTSQQQDARPARENRKDKDLNTFLNSMDKYAPIVIFISTTPVTDKQIPDAVTDYYLSLAGFECSDQRMYLPAYFS